MDLKRRKLRLALALVVAIVAAVTLWRTNTAGPGSQPCTPDKQVEKDADGKVTKITRRTCRDG